MDSPFQFQDQQDQRRALSEDSVSYAIYLAPTADLLRQDHDQGDRTKSNLTVSLEAVHIAKALISSVVSKLAKDYIWHKDAFSLRVETGKGKLVDNQPHLRGETRFGDSLDDEWMVVFLLREISRQIPGSIVKVQDNDGEFLLIEAADYIPSWLDPDNSDNRVFIYDGDLHIIPIAVTEQEKATFPLTVGSKSKSPKLVDALDIIRSSQRVDSYATLLEQSHNANEQSTSNAVKTLAHPKIQQAAFGPLTMSSVNPEDHFATKKIREQRHYARCRIPVDVARILKSRPELVTRACEAFYTRDPIAMATCSRMSKFLPTASTTTSGPTAVEERKKIPFVTTAVCFTKTCYAQLMGQQFQPPKSWNGIVPRPGVEDPKLIKEAELGMKLTCGFEILCSPEYPGDFGHKGGQEIQFKDFPFATDYGWRVFKNNLTIRKYFGNERLGSQGYKQLEESAKVQFLEFKSHQLLGEEEASSGTESQLGTVSFHGHGYHPVEEIERILATTPIPDANTLVNDRTDDDESWMEVDLKDLEAMMKARGLGGAFAANTEQATSSTGLDMQQMLDKFGEFIQEGKGGIEGAEFLDEQSDEDDDDDDDEDEDESESEENRTEHEKMTMDSRTDAIGVESEVESQDEDEEDMFASDYEERQSKKLTRKQGKQGNDGMFGSGDMVFDYGLTEEAEAGSSACNKLELTPNQAPQALALDHDKFKGILLNTFGISPSGADRTVNAKNANNVSNGGGDSGDEEDILSDQSFKKYMDELDAELAGTKVGQSFEKMVVPHTADNDSHTKRQTKHQTEVQTSNVKDKGKGIVNDTPARPSTSNRKKLAPKAEKSVEELFREHADRQRRTFSRQGPLPTTRTGEYGYDPAVMALVDDDDMGEDEEQDEDVDVELDSTAMEARITALPSDDEGDADEDTQAREVVDVDLNLAKNLLESFKSQGGLPGPGGNLLSRLGIVLPRDEGEEDD